MEGGSVPIGPTAVGVVLAVLVVASTSGAGLGPVDSALDSTRTVTSDALGAVGVDVAVGDDESQPVSYDESVLERAIQRRVNAERATVDRSPVVWSDRLRRIARYHSADMARHEYVAHESPTGNTTADRYERFGHDCELAPGHDSLRVGENLARISLDGTVTNETEFAERVVQGWMESESHRQTLLANPWDRAAVGVTVVNRTDGTVAYVTQNFC